MRTESNIWNNYRNYCTEGKGNRKNLKHFKNCEFPPMKLKNGQDNVEVIFTLQPAPLHCNLLGPMNDGVSKLESYYLCEMEPF